MRAGVRVEAVSQGCVEAVRILIASTQLQEIESAGINTSLETRVELISARPAPPSPASRISRPRLDQSSLLCQSPEGGNSRFRLFTASLDITDYLLQRNLASLAAARRLSDLRIYTSCRLFLSVHYLGQHNPLMLRPADSNKIYFSLTKDLPDHTNSIQAAKKLDPD